MVMIDLPSGVVIEEDMKNIRTSLADEGNMLVVMVLYPDIMVEDGLEEFYLTWKRSKQGFMRMVKSGMDKEVNDYKQSVLSDVVMGIFNLALVPLDVDPYYMKHWIANNSKC